MLNFIDRDKQKQQHLIEQINKTKDLKLKKAMEKRLKDHYGYLDNLYSFY